MTKSELMVRLAEVFAEKNGNQLLAKDVEYSVKVLVDTMTRSLARGQRIEIRGFGSFDLNHRPARIGRNPKTGEQLSEGKIGELCFTHLTKEGMPLLRYRTHDLTALHYDRCSCGRTFVRMDRILGRCDDMLIIRGVNVFPTQIETVILSLKEFEPHYLLTVNRENNTDTAELKVEVKDKYFSDEMSLMVGLQKRLVIELRSVIGLGFNVKLVEPKSIERSTGKSKRVIDNRKL